MVSDQESGSSVSVDNLVIGQYVNSAHMHSVDLGVQPTEIMCASPQCT